MTRIMYDTVTPEAIPQGAAVVAGYDNGSYAWSQADWDRFPNALHVHIDVAASHDSSQVLDVEIGDARPSDAPGWVARRRAANQHRPTVYCNQSTWAEVRSEFRLQNVPEPDYWIAEWTGAVHDIPGAVAVQFADPSFIVGRPNYDMSCITDPTWPDTGHAIPPFPGVTKLGSVGNAVKQVQQRLKDRGWSITVDGQFGPKTDATVRAYQTEKHLVVDGIVGPLTWNSLWTAPLT